MPGSVFTRILKQKGNVMSNKKNVAVLGAGVMGTGIAQLFASKGYPVTIIYVYDDIVRAKPLETMQENLKILCDNDVMREDEIPSILENVTCTEDMEAAAKSADIIFECIVEDLATKQEYFKKLDEICAPETFWRTNTSVISVTEIAEKSIHKERIIGTHFWKPAYIIPLVEVVKTEHVSEKVVNETFSLLQEAGKKPVIVQKDVPGFLAEPECNMPYLGRRFPSSKKELRLLRMLILQLSMDLACDSASWHRWK